MQAERVFAFKAKRRRCSSVNRRRLPPSISRSTLISSFWYAITACWCRLIHPASININNCPGEHHDFDFMGAILSRMTTRNGAAERPQSADILPNIRRSSFGTLRDHGPAGSSATRPGPTRPGRRWSRCRVVGGYLRGAEIRSPRKSHPTGYLRPPVPARIDNLPEREAGVRDFALVPQLALEFPIHPRKLARLAPSERFLCLFMSAPAARERA